MLNSSKREGALRSPGWGSSAAALTQQLGICCMVPQDRGQASPLQDGANKSSSIPESTAVEKHNLTPNRGLSGGRLTGCADLQSITEN
ncbi:hypothetical protein I79_017014 [Cricetulus griseus]|uniref:Uncharacterized protein n=1 Tax=Cricetulus griseus TaxID=10029 RepID=G3I0X2_CRIGR|nr:hypothetical protein I79_017014 [Cricetulus griseus]